MRRLLAVGLMAAVVTGCGDDASDTTEPPAADVVLRIVMDGEVAADWTLAELEAKTSFVNVEVFGDAQEGPRLEDVLYESGIDGWNSAEVIGMGEGRIFEVTLDVSAAEVSRNWVLDVTKQGTLKLASPDLARQNWVRDVGEIRLR